MDTQKLTYFISAVKHMNFTKAAHECHIAQTAMSRNIVSLERELGFPLFYRNNRNVTLTVAGETFYKEAVLLMEELERAVNKTRLIANGHEGVLRIGFGPSAEQELVSACLAQFTERFPKVELVCLEYNYNMLIEHLTHGFLDVIFSLSCCPGVMDGSVFKEIKRTKLYVMMNRRHPLAAKESLRTSDLEGESFVIHSEKGGPLSAKDFLETCSLLGFRPGGTLVVNTYEAKMLTVQVGQKVALITAGQRKHLSAEFRAFPIPSQRIQAAFYATMLQCNNNPAAREFFNLLPTVKGRKTESIQQI